MNFEIIVNDKPNLKTTEMICDKPIHNKLNNYELTKFLNCHSTNLLIGKPASGKTSLLVSLFNNKDCLKKCYHNIFLFQPSASETSIKQNPFKELPDDQKFNELNYQSLELVYNKLQNEDKKFNNVIIIDDMTAYLKDKDIMQLFKNIVWNRRHLRTSIYFLTQSFYSIPKEIRRVFSNLFIFKTSKEELENIAIELFEIKKEIIPDLRKFIYDERFNFLFVNIDTQTYFKNWDKIII